MNTACLSTIGDEPATMLTTGMSVDARATGEPTGPTEPLAM